MIEVIQVSDHEPLCFRVTIQDRRGSSQHEVTLASALWQRLAGGDPSAASFIEAVFAFLLDREPREAILERFDCAVIGRYFPEFETAIGAYLPHRSPP